MACGAAALLLVQGGCSGAGRQDGNTVAQTATMQEVTITGATGQHRFTVERADTAAAQERGLMYRTDIPRDGGMLFAPFPPEGGPPQVATIWMKNTPSALDILFIRADGTIARIAGDAVPLSETMLSSGEPVAAVLEIRGGRAGALGIVAGDHVRWSASG